MQSNNDFIFQKLDYHWYQTAMFEADCLVQCLTWNLEGGLLSLVKIKHIFFFVIIKLILQLKKCYSNDLFEFEITFVRIIKLVIDFRKEDLKSIIYLFV